MHARQSGVTLTTVLALCGLVVFLYQNQQLVYTVKQIRQLGKVALDSGGVTVEIHKLPTPVVATSKPSQVPTVPPTREVVKSRSQMSENELAVLKNRLNLMFWPALTGYNQRQSTPERNGPDPLLLDRILLHQHTYTQPLLRVRDQAGHPAPRHEWRFEKIIHQTWKDTQIPGQTAPWVKKWLEVNPDWTYMFWTDQSAQDFLSDHYPSLMTAYLSFHIPVQRADFFRYVALYALGGVYADLDMEVLRGLDQVRDWGACLLGREPDPQTYIVTNELNFWANNWTFTSNAFMACRSHHPFMHYVISRVVHWSPFILKKHCILDATIACTGPFMLAFSYTYYRRSIPEELRRRRKEYDVICPAYEFFLPTFDSEKTELVKKRCASGKLDERQRGVCAVYADRGQRNEPLSQSYTTHHWFHSYHTDVNKDRVDVTTLTKVLQWTRERENTDFDVTYPTS